MDGSIKKQIGTGIGEAGEAEVVSTAAADCMMGECCNCNVHLAALMRSSNVG